MPNKHFCQGPHCHTKTTSDRFLKSRGVVRGKYAYATLDQGPNQWGWTPRNDDKYFCSQACKLEWLAENMTAIEMKIPVPFITHRRESQGYHKVTNDNRWGASHSIERVDNRTEID